MNDFNSIVRKNLETYDNETLVKKLKSGNLTEEAQKICHEIIQERADLNFDKNIHSPTEEITQLEDEAQVIRGRLKLMNATLVIMWGFSILLLTLAFLSSFVTYKSQYSLIGLLPLGVFSVIAFYISLETWKACHYTEKPQHSKYAKKINFLYFFMLVFLFIVLFSLGQKFNAFITGFVFWVVIPNLINLKYLPKIAIDKAMHKE